jgi:tRNA threonylcarbamoyl adenosine modification protein (Sua5/YciO/YrdC/YwlC family)
MLIKIYPQNPNVQQVSRVVETLKSGGIVILPTDSVYAFACDIFNASAVESILLMKEKNLRKAELSMICNSLRQISEYARMDDDCFRLIKKNLPGPFTFLLRGSNRLPRIFKDKKTVGIRMPDNNIPLEIVRELGNPLMVSSIFVDDESHEYITDPELIHEKFGYQVDMVIDGGMGGLEPSTIVDCTGEEFEIVREGAGLLNE